MPDPNNPGVPPGELPPEEALEGSQPTSENAEESSPPTETPSEPTEKPSDESDSNESGNDSATSPTEPDATEGDVNDDEVGVVEGVGADRELEEAELPEDVGSNSRDVSVTCFKCDRKTDTMVTRKQFEDQAESGEQPTFKTKCKFCNYISTYVLTGEGTRTLA